MKRVSLLFAIIFSISWGFGQTSCFTEGFSDITNGDNTDPDGSGTAWTGNPNFPTVDKAFQAGGAVKLGSGSAVGSIESKQLDAVEGNITVKIWVKGWTTIEGDLIISIDTKKDTLSYTSKMADTFQLITTTFTNVAVNSNLKIETSAKRAFIDSIAVICAPTAPTCETVTNLVATDNKNGSVTATWDAPTTAPTDGYRVYIAKDSDAMPTTYFTTDNATTTFSTDTLINGTNLADGDTYNVYVVAACDSMNSEVSDTANSSVTVSIIAPCDTITNLTVIDNTNGTFTVKWDSQTPAPADGYRIHVTNTGNPVPTSYFATNDTTFTIDSLKNGNILIHNESYDVYVIAVCDSLGSSFSDTTKYNAVVTNTTPCDSITNIVTTNNNDGSITITWDALATTPALGIYLAITPSGGSSTAFFTLNGSETTFTTDTLADGSILYLGDYDIYLAANCGGILMPVKDSVTVAYPVPCGEVTNLDAINNDDGTITVNWNAPLYLPAEGYLLAVVKEGDTLADTSYFTISKDSITFTTDTLTNGDALLDSVSYVVSIYSVCHLASDSISGAINDTVTVTIAPEPCFAPTNLTITDNGYGELTATWSASASTTASSYQIAIMPQGTDPTNADFFNTTDTTFVSDTLRNGTPINEGDTYTVYVYTDCSSTSLTSDTAQATEQLSVEPCAAPANLVVTKNGNNSVNIAWDPISPAPENGYYYAIGKAGVSLNFPADYQNTTATSVNNITTTTTGIALEETGIYTVYVLASCKAIHGDSPKTTRNFTTTVGLNDVSNVISGVYPNPANTFVTVALNTEKATISFVDMTGKTILTQTTSTATTQLDINHLASGIYQMLVQTETTTSVVTFVKE